MNKTTEMIKVKQSFWNGESEAVCTIGGITPVEQTEQLSIMDLMNRINPEALAYKKGVNYTEEEALRILNGESLGIYPMLMEPSEVFTRIKRMENLAEEETMDLKQKAEAEEWLKQREERKNELEGLMFEALKGGKNAEQQIDSTK